jgi:membrane-bound lytic murein transglycosylase D
MVKVELLRGLLVSFSFLFIMPFAIGSGARTGDDFSTDRMYLDNHARLFVKNYIQNNSPKLYSIKQKSQAPFAITDSVFDQYHLPRQLKYLAVIESELNSSATSRVGAVGPWQLMPATARLLGLKVTEDCDERTQYGKSTRAAAIYLKDLYAEFGDWLLVLAAYNGGPGSVYHAIHLSGSRNFWDLQAYLPAESRMHVKKFIAASYYFEGRTAIRSGGFIANVPYKASLGDGQQGLFHGEF